MLAHIAGGVMAGVALGTMLAGDVAKGIAIAVVGTVLVFGRRLSDPSLFRPRD